MNKRLGALLIVVAAVAAAGGMFATPSTSAGNPPSCDPTYGCPVHLTATGPSPATLTMNAFQHVRFYNEDSGPHTVVFANGLCSLTLPPDQGLREQGADCVNQFMSFAGSYAYTMDGKFPGTVVTRPWRRSVTLTARSHTIRGGTRLILHGRIVVNNPGISPPVPVVVLARHTSKRPFEAIATVRTNYYAAVTSNNHVTYGWRLNLRPGSRTTYIAEVTTQRSCYSPTSRCGHPQGQGWTNPKSSPFTVRIRH